MGELFADGREHVEGMVEGVWEGVDAADGWAAIWGGVVNTDVVDFDILYV